MNNPHYQRLNDVAHHAERLMTDLGRDVLDESLQQRGWSFGFDRAKRRLGCCTWSKNGQPVKRITVSRYFVMLHGLGYKDETGLQVVDDVIRHEIAHAIDYEQRGVSHHDSTWKTLCQRTGADPSRLYEGNGLAEVPGKYVAICPNCGLETQLYRRPKRRQACKACCDEYNDGAFSAQFELSVRDRATGAWIRIRNRSFRA